MKRKHQHIFNIFTGLFVAVFSMAMSGCGTQHRHEKNLDQTTAQSISEKQLSMYSSASLPSVTDSLYETPSGKDRACLIYKLLAIRHKEFPADATISVHANMKL